MSTGVDLIAKERDRQIAKEGWTPEHDDKHKRFQMSKAAHSYLALVTDPDEFNTPPQPCNDWPWTKKWWKPSYEPVRNLVKAGALICAEIDRLQRADGKPDVAVDKMFHTIADGQCTETKYGKTTVWPGRHGDELSIMLRIETKGEHPHEILLSVVGAAAICILVGGAIDKLNTDFPEEIEKLAAEYPHKPE